MHIYMHCLQICKQIHKYLFVCICIFIYMAWSINMAQSMHWIALEGVTLQDMHTLLWGLIDLMLQCLMFPHNLHIMHICTTSIFYWYSHLCNSYPLQNVHVHGLAWEIDTRCELPQHIMKRSFHMKLIGGGMHTSNGLTSCFKAKLL